jgi:hypothetical protein
VGKDLALDPDGLPLVLMALLGRRRWMPAPDPGVLVALPLQPWRPAQATGAALTWPAPQRRAAGRDHPAAGGAVLIRARDGAGDRR